MIVQNGKGFAPRGRASPSKTFLSLDLFGTMHDRELEGMGSER